ncbi:MAG: hypothetical protein ABMB14_20725 [Myxococcota bacterium]
MVLVPLPYGEIVDRIVILDLKCARVSDPARVAQARALRDAIAAAWTAAGLPEVASLDEHPALVDVNAELWDVEDAVRDHEARGSFDAAFTALARRVYLANDRRAALKAAIDRRLGSPLTEPKSFPLQTAT